MGEIAELMTTGAMCSKCSVALHEDCAMLGIPVECNDCHRGHATLCRNGIYGEAGILKILSSDNPIDRIKPYVEYNLQIARETDHDLFYNRTKMVNFISDFTYQMIEAEED